MLGVLPVQVVPELSGVRLTGGGSGPPGRSLVNIAASLRGGGAGTRQGLLAGGLPLLLDRHPRLGVDEADVEQLEVPGNVGLGDLYVDRARCAWGGVDRVAGL